MISAALKRNSSLTELNLRGDEMKRTEAKIKTKTKMIE